MNSQHCVPRLPSPGLVVVPAILCDRSVPPVGANAAAVRLPCDGLILVSLDGEPLGDL
jgi:hypothetical protein